MKLSIVIILAFTINVSFSQSDSLKAIAEVKKFREELDAEYKNPKESPLEKVDFKNFKGHSYFPLDLKYRVHAKLELTPDTKFFEMKTSGSLEQLYRMYGYAIFKIDRKEFRIPVYQSKSLMTMTGYEDYLFFPFTDLTNGTSTYGGGRYIGLRIPKSVEIIIDFNQAYNPYCAYSQRFSCPIVPKENDFAIEIPAGVKLEPR